MKGVVAAYQSWFANPDYATVVLVGVVIVLIQGIVLAGLTGGRWPLLAAGFFAVEGIAQVHHIVKTIGFGSYFPGAVTAVPYVPIATMLLIAVVRASRSGAPARGYGQPVEA